MSAPLQTAHRASGFRPRPSARVQSATSPPTAVRLGISNGKNNCKKEKGVRQPAAHQSDRASGALAPMQATVRSSLVPAALVACLALTMLLAAPPLHGMAAEQFTPPAVNSMSLPARSPNEVAQGAELTFEEQLAEARRLGREEGKQLAEARRLGREEGRAEARAEARAEQIAQDAGKIVPIIVSTVFVLAFAVEGIRFFINKATGR